MVRATVCMALLFLSTAAHGQGSAPADAHTGQRPNTGPSNWMVMYDGQLFATFNKQTSARGDTQFRSQNWLMVMASRPVGKVQLTLSGMFSAEPATVTARGYAHLFQVGETYKGLENTDRQHPHDLFSQLALTMRLPLGDRAGVTLSVAPVGEATLGPVAFMHRASAADNPSSPLAHHTLDSTHVANGVVALAFDIGPLILEGSAFRGREPDEKRWDLTPGRLDSGAARIWFRPSEEWIGQVSYGKLEQPEQLIPGDVYRTTASLSWTRGFLALTGMYGHNKRTYSASSAYVSELTSTFGKESFFGRFEWCRSKPSTCCFRSPFISRMSANASTGSKRSPSAACTISGAATAGRRSASERTSGSTVCHSSCSRPTASTRCPFTCFSGSGRPRDTWDAW